MVNIGRHGNIITADKPCLPQAYCSGQIWNTEATSTNGRDSRDSQSKSFNTSEQIPRNNTLYYRLPLAAYDGQCELSASLDPSCKYSKSTISLSLDRNSDSSPRVAGDPYSLDTLPYLELPLVCRANHPYLATSSNFFYQSQFHSRSSIFGNYNLKFAFLCFILSMLLLCKSCVCIVCSESPRFTNKTSRQWYLTFVDETNVQGLSGRCLTMTGSFAGDMCQPPSTDPNRRMDILRQTRTNFCGLPLTTIMSDEDINTVLCARENCAHVLSGVQALDEELSGMFCQFEDVLKRIDCGDTFANMGNCTICKVSQMFSSVIFVCPSVCVSFCIAFCPSVSLSVSFDFISFEDYVIYVCF